MVRIVVMLGDRQISEVHSDTVPLVGDCLEVLPYSTPKVRVVCRSFVEVSTGGFLVELSCEDATP